MHSSNDPTKVARAMMLEERENDAGSLFLHCSLIAADEQEMC